MANKEQKTMLLACKLTGDEIMQQARQMARFNNEQDRLEDEAKVAATQFKNSIQSAATNFRKAAGMVSSGIEYRNVKVREEMNLPQKGDKTIYREDTGELVRVEMMEKDDFQLVLLREREAGGGDPEAGDEAEEVDGDEDDTFADNEFKTGDAVRFRADADADEEEARVAGFEAAGMVQVERADGSLVAIHRSWLSHAPVVIEADAAGNLEPEAGEKILGAVKRLAKAKA